MSKRHDIGGRSGHLPSEVVELAVIFVAAGAVHLLTTAAGHAAYGPALLMAVGVAGVVVMMAGRRMLARRLPAREPAPAAGSVPATCTECGAAGEIVLIPRRSGEPG